MTHERRDTITKNTAIYISVGSLIAGVLLLWGIFDAAYTIKSSIQNTEAAVAQLKAEKTKDKEELKEEIRAIKATVDKFDMRDYWGLFHQEVYTDQFRKNHPELNIPQPGKIHRELR